MKCHYEVLEVARDAGVDDVRKSYLKLSLRYHPDKNPIEQAAEYNALFTLIKRAYEVLSDPQERAWYDRHREAILRAEEHGQVEKETESVDLLQFFTTSCYASYDDQTPTGFYSVFRQAFEQIAAEEMRHAENVVDAKFPPFGTPQSEIEDVKAFYDFWTRFSTLKSYDWIDTYKPEYGMANRQVYRHYDKQSKKVRDQMKAERSDTIRSLAEFVKKRDPRMKKLRRLVEQRAREQQEALQRKLHDQKQAHLEERRRLMQTFEDDESADHFEAALRALESQQQNGDDGDNVAGGNDDDADADDTTVLYCLVCEKDFRTAGQKENHMRSKQHKRAAEILRERMLQQNMKIEALAEQFQGVDVKELERQLDIRTATPANSAAAPSFTAPSAEAVVDAADVAAACAGNVSNEQTTNSSTTTKKKAKRKQRMQIDKIDSDADDYSKETAVGPKATGVKTGDVNKSPASKTNTEIVTAADTPVDDAETAENYEIIDAPPPSSTQNNTGGKSDSSKAPKSAAAATAPASAEISHNQIKREKARRKKLQLDSGGGDADEDTTTILRCKVCKAEFSTRNKLFTHIKDTGHAVLKKI